jgi:hypothetical protein
MARKAFQRYIENFCNWQIQSRKQKRKGRPNGPALLVELPTC